MINRVLKLCVLCSINFLISGCLGSISENHSQWRGDEENQNRLAKMYAQTIPICDGKPVGEHRKCVASVRKEFSQRFADRFSAYYTARSAESLLASAIVLSYVIDSNSSKSSSNSTTSNGSKSGTSKLRLCRTHQFSSQFSVSLSSFTAIPVTCA